MFYRHADMLITCKELMAKAPIAIFKNMFRPRIAMFCLMDISGASRTCPGRNVTTSGRRTVSTCTSNLLMLHAMNSSTRSRNDKHDPSAGKVTTVRDQERTYAKQQIRIRQQAPEHQPD